MRRHHDAKQQRERRGLTLVELLGVVVLLGLASSALVRTPAAEAARARTDALVRSVAALDARARIAARHGSGVVLAVEPAQHALVARVRGSGEEVGRVALSDEGSVVVSRARELRPGAIRYRADGTADDGVVEVRDGARAIRLTIAGLTGWVSTTETTP